MVPLFELERAYEAAKSGKAAVPARQARGRATATRRGSKRDSLLALIRESAAGLTRGEIIERMGLKGNKSGEMSVSNALTALTKGNQVSRQGGKYRPSICSANRTASSPSRAIACARPRPAGTSRAFRH